MYLFHTLALALIFVCVGVCFLAAVKGNSMMGGRCRPGMGMYMDGRDSDNEDDAGWTDTSWCMWTYATSA
jgi:hypothetical protein